MEKKYRCSPKSLTRIISFNYIENIKQPLLTVGENRNINKKLHILKRSRSQINDRKEKGLDWKKWMIKQQKYRISCHLDKFTNLNKNKSILKTQIFPDNRLNKVRNQLRRLKKIDRQIKFLKKNQQLVSKIDSENTNNINGYFDIIENQISDMKKKY